LSSSKSLTYQTYAIQRQVYSSTWNNFDQNVASVKIYLNKLTYTLIEESPVMDIIILLSNVGGALGLFIGPRVLSIIEFVDAFMDVVNTSYNYKKQPTNVIQVRPAE
jgi:hypothetical protein